MIARLKHWARRVRRHVEDRLGTQAPFDSSRYWAERYGKGGTSGAGSEGALADYKASIVNGLVRDRGIASVIEFGSGDGRQAALFDLPDYTGVDVVPEVVANCAALLGDRPGWRFMTRDDFLREPRSADLSMSLDVIYHLIEDDVFDAYMRMLTGAARRYVLIYSSDHAGTRLGRQDRHVMHRAYSDWITRHAPHLELVETFQNPLSWRRGLDPRATSFAFFRLFAVTPAPTVEVAGP